MTETSPIATLGMIKSTLADRHGGRNIQTAREAGLAAPFIEFRVMRPEGEAPWDGATSGRTRNSRPMGCQRVISSPRNPRSLDERWVVSNRRHRDD